MEPRRTSGGFGRFDGLVALVTGGARGIGLGIARRLAEAGAEVHVFDREAGPEVPGVAFHAADLRATASVAAAVAALVRGRRSFLRHFPI